MIINFTNKTEHHIRNAYVGLKDRYRDVRFPSISMRAGLCTGFFIVDKCKVTSKKN